MPVTGSKTAGPAEFLRERSNSGSLFKCGGWLVYLVLALSPGSASWAQSTGARISASATYGKHPAKQEASAALSARDPQRAEEILNSAFRAELDLDPEYLYLLGCVAAAQGRAVAALDLYHRYLELVGSGASPEATSAIEKHASSVSSPITKVSVSAPDGMLLWVDDRLAGVLPLRSPLWLPGGSHRFSLERHGIRYESDSLQFPESREAELRLTPGDRGTAISVLSLTPIMMVVLRSKSIAPALYQSVSKAVPNAVRRKHLEVLSDLRLKALLSPRPAECLNELECQLAVAEQARALWMLVVEVTGPGGAEGAEPSASCGLQLLYVDVTAGQVAARTSASNIPCEGPALTAAIARMFPALWSEAVSRSRGLLAVESVPEGAQVRVDGVSRGVAPLVMPALSGPHEVVLEGEYYLASHTQVVVVPGQVAKVQVHLHADLFERPKLPPQVPRPPADQSRPPLVVARRTESLPPFRMVFIEQHPRRRPLRLALGSIALGSSLLMASFGIAALAVNGQCVDQPLLGYLCSTVHNTSAVGGGLLGAGLALSSGSIVVLALTGPRKRIPLLLAPE